METPLDPPTRCISGFSQDQINENMKYRGPGFKGGLETPHPRDQDPRRCSDSKARGMRMRVSGWYGGLMVKYLSNQPPTDKEDPDVMRRFLSSIMELTQGSWFTVADVVEEIDATDLPLRLKVSLATNAPGYTKSFGRALCYGGEIAGDLEVETYARGKRGRVYRIVRKGDQL